ncbi:MAG: cell division protein FtsH [Anaerolineaceae bacterium]|nr:cell division protein FtsH [Anaerolineaceae bacterium]|tara:strand:- start:35645 stop:37597 length:1953 start_codon:yes stop_codon:yes gene_type:complete
MRNSLVYVLIVIALGAILYSVRTQSGPKTELTISEVATQIERGNVEKIVVAEDDLTIYFRPGAEYELAITRKESASTAPEQFATLGVSEQARSNVKWEVQRPGDWGNIMVLLSYTLPAIFVIGFIYFILRQAQGTNNQALSFGKSKARMFAGDQPTVTFDDVAGADEAKEELQEVVEFLQEPEKFIGLGARIPKGVLLVGSPGTGKTLLAKAVSGEAGVPFFSISGSEFVEMFVGVGASRVRDLFEQAKRHSPCIVFVDEIDAVGRQRGAGLGGSHDEREQTLNQILVEMDGFDTDTNVIIVAATNRPDILDPALLRPGRFDRRVVLDRPDMVGREAIFKVHVRGKPLDPDVKLDVLAKATPGFVGADIENTVNEAAILAARTNQKSISMHDMEAAVERVVLGPERKSRIITERERKITAYHEAGHAVVSRAQPEGEPVRKITIIPRGIAAGLTWYLTNDEDQRLATKSKLKARLAAMLGGRAAEELVFDKEEVTTGASNDLEQVTSVARQMVTRWGMSDKLGPMAFGKKEELVFLGREIGEQRDFSEAVAEEIDSEVRSLVDSAHKLAGKLLKKHNDKLDEVANYLLEHETLELDQFEALWNGEPIPPPKPPPSAPPSSDITEDVEEEATSNDDSAKSGNDPLPIPSGA